ncbi:MAG TPA: hypothetical protein VGQ44_17350 [Gemmatimonadaceae bacterium]|jgi:cell division protein FtsB|nr:hypothetical protein [Gemmatimonadaceae bacterium]
MPSPNASDQGQAHAHPSAHAHIWLDVLLTPLAQDGSVNGSDVVQALTRLARAVEANTLLLETIMASVAELQAQADALKQAVTDGLARIQAHEDAEAAADTALQAQVATLTQANTDLQAQIDALKAGGTDTTALDAILATMKDATAQIGTIDPAPAPVPETPVP